MFGDKSVQGKVPDTPGGGLLMFCGYFVASSSGALVKMNGIMVSTKYQDIPG